MAGRIGQDEAMLVVGNPHPRHFPGCYSVCSDAEENEQERSEST